jgi:polyhydroxyalkanoate synthesis regulator phasin
MPPKPRPSRTDAGGPDAKAAADAVTGALTAIRDLLARGVVLTGDRLQETVDDAVSRGRMTRTDAEDLVARLVSGGRRQTEDMLAEIEKLLGRGAGVLPSVARETSRRVDTALRSEGSDIVIRQVDRARRAAGLGPTFPILGYESLPARQITARLDDLTAAQLRKVRDHERRHKARKSVLAAIEKRLSS